MNKITILIENNKEFGDIAFLVDNPKFLEAIDRLRDKWGIKNLINIDQLGNWQNNLFKQRESKQGEQNQLKIVNVDDLSDCDLEAWKEKIERVMPNVDFECDVRDLRIQFDKPETFDKAITHAIMCGIIPDGVYKSTYYGIEATTTPLRLQDRTARIAIYITPQSTDEEVSKVVGETRKVFFKTKMWGIYPFFSLRNKDQVTNIKRDRGWYWRNLGGESYMQIAIADNLKRKSDKYWIQDYAEKVRKALKRYSDALSAT